MTSNVERSAPLSDISHLSVNSVVAPCVQLSRKSYHENFEI
jgi:hypothetical protein